MTLANSAASPRWNFRLVLVCFAAVSVSLPIAWISLAKVLLVVAGLCYLMANTITGRGDLTITKGLTSKAILATLLLFFFSLLWTDIGMDIALLALVKHAKLIVIFLLIYLIRTQREARVGVIAFTAGQIFVLLSSWLLAADVPLPWVTDPNGKYVVFSTYLDQSIMFATTAAVFWHLRQERLWLYWLAVILSVAALADTLLLLDGRTGYAVAIAMLSLAIMWAMPKHLRITALLVAPLLVLTGLYWGSTHLQSRVSKVFEESRNFSTQVETQTSSGWRLNAWQRSVEAIRENPWYGHGVGSWAITVKRLQGDTAAKTFGEGNASNPHQEYLLWGVELGVAGSLMFIALLLAMALDARRFRPPIQRAVWSTLTALAVACLFNSALYDDLMGDFFCVALGMLMALGFRSAYPQVNQAAAVAAQEHSQVAM